jgi:hypothetical protein
MLPIPPIDCRRMVELNASLAANNGNVTKYEALDRHAAAMRDKQTQSTASVQAAGPRTMRQEPGPTARLLELAYARPCLICGKDGACRHREPAVELALMRQRG